MMRRFNRRARDLGLTQSQLQALAFLVPREGINQAALAEMMDIQPITLARLIDRLEESGLVERRRDPDDRRAVNLYIGKNASPLIDKMWEFAAETRRDALSGLSDDEQEVMIDTLQRMRMNLISCEQDSADKNPPAGKSVLKGKEE
ncbi:MarR family winged helix-turn-helix transcriptional regulator [Thalassospira mesophila]|uniref:MarR family winged helix-turn-helix transcriptional regulator n=1 Tax=Thalassospira mesophila TaxID=1293891 RepID=UPI000A1F19BF|nr:MarR family transcriptional regulator [Thalassospira mesophila]